MADGYQVHPDELTKFAGDLHDKIAPALDEAGKAVQNCQGMHHEAFGLVFAQIFGSWTRAAFAEKVSSLFTLRDHITDAADRVTKAGQSYQSQEQAVQDQLKAFGDVLGDGKPGAK